MLVINNEYLIMKYNFDKIQADYKAEIAINKAVRMIENNEIINSGTLENISGSLCQEDDYYIEEAKKHIDDLENIIYYIRAEGKSGSIKSYYNLNIKKPDSENE